MNDPNMMMNMMNYMDPNFMSLMMQSGMGKITK
jgi:hypothetical protein